MKEENWKYSWDHKTRYALIHIPKTAGTTFREIAHGHFPDDLIFPNRNELKKNKGKYYKDHEIKEISIPDNKCFIFGHFSFKVFEELPQEYKKICFFRNPMDRILSHIGHFVRNDNIEEDDPNDIIDKYQNQIISLQAKKFGFDKKKADWNIIKRNLDSIDIIGITDHFDKSIELINLTFDWKLQNIEKQNVGKTLSYEDLSSKSKHKIISNIRAEIHCYNIAYGRFKNLLKENNLSIV